jgi:hypothetical protein
MESVTIPESHKRDKNNWEYYVISWYPKYTILVDKSKKRWLNQNNSF